MFTVAVKNKLLQYKIIFFNMNIGLEDYLEKNLTLYAMLEKTQ